jgi:hypothetical protein
MGVETRETAWIWLKVNFLLVDAERWEPPCQARHISGGFWACSRFFFLLEHVGELHIINKRARRLKGQEPIRHTNLTDIKKRHLPFNVLVFAINIWRSVRNRMRQQVLALTGTVKKGSPVFLGKGPTTLDLYVCNLSLYSRKSLFLGLEPMTLWSQDNNITADQGSPCFDWMEQYCK